MLFFCFLPPQYHAIPSLEGMMISFFLQDVAIIYCPRFFVGLASFLGPVSTSVPTEPAPAPTHPRTHPPTAPTSSTRASPSTPSNSFASPPTSPGTNSTLLPATSPHPTLTLTPLTTSAVLNPFILPAAARYFRTTLIPAVADAAALVPGQTHSLPPQPSS
ncbi:hypothetical protein PMIN03_011576 [Paraphaeosphaeria minitans]